MTTLTIIFIALALIFNFLNGYRDSSNIVATIIFSHALPPRVTLWTVAVGEFCGPFIFGVAVARTIGTSIVSPDAVTIQILLAAVVGAIVWNIITWWLSLPSSSSQALIGGMVGAVGAGIGLDQIKLSGLTTVLIALFTSPIIGFIVGYLLTRLIYFLARNATMRINWWFKRAQILTGILLALSHGANDGQKIMGVIAMGLVATGQLAHFDIPRWVVAISAVPIALGTGTGGWRLIKTLGSKFYKIRPVNGFGTQVSSTIVILGGALIGGPVSTTQVVGSAIMGVGAAERLNKVRWGVAGNILAAWFLTIPASAVLSALLFLAFRNLR